MENYKGVITIEYMPTNKVYKSDPIYGSLSKMDFWKKKIKTLTTAQDFTITIDGKDVHLGKGVLENSMISFEHEKTFIDSEINIMFPQPKQKTLSLNKWLYEGDLLYLKVPINKSIVEREYEVKSCEHYPEKNFQKVVIIDIDYRM